MDSTHFSYQSVVFNFGKHIDDFVKMNPECLRMTLKLISERMDESMNKISELRNQIKKLEKERRFHQYVLNTCFTKIIGEKK